MGKFIIKPQKTQNPRLYNDAFLWKEISEKIDIYVMLNHRLSLWCWLQNEDILGKKHSLIFIDEHCDMCSWNEENSTMMESILKDFDKLIDYSRYNSFKCVNRDFDFKVSCIHRSNFLYIAAKVNLFENYNIYSWAEHEFKKVFKEIGLSSNRYNLYENTKKDVVKYLESDIKNNTKCIVDIDLDFFDKIEGEDNKIKTLKYICEIIKKYKDKISCITIAITDIPTDKVWKERQEQLSVINKILSLNIPVPILTNKEICLFEKTE